MGEGVAGDWAEPGERQGAGLSHGHLGGDLLASVCRGPELGDQEWQMPPPKDQAGVEKDGDRWEWVVCEPWGGNGVTEGSQGGRWEMWCFVSAFCSLSFLLLYPASP